MKSKKPIGIILLTIFLVWGVFKSLGILFRTSSVDIQLLSMYRLSVVFYFYAMIILLLGIYLVYAFWKAKKTGYKAFFWFCGLNIAYTLLILTLSLTHKDKLVEFYTASRLARGLSVVNVESLVSSNLLIIGSVAAVLLYVGVSYYVLKKKGYFFK